MEPPSWNDRYITINCANETEETRHGFAFWHDDNVILIGNQLHNIFRTLINWIITEVNKRSQKILYITPLIHLNHSLHSGNSHFCWLTGTGDQMTYFQDSDWLWCHSRLVLCPTKAVFRSFQQNKTKNVRFCTYFELVSVFLVLYSFACLLQAGKRIHIYLVFTLGQCSMFVREKRSRRFKNEQPSISISFLR